MKAIITEKYYDYFEYRLDGLTFRGHDAQELAKFVKESVKGITEVQVDFYASRIGYEQLRDSGMLYELIPDACGEWEKDRRKFIAFRSNKNIS